MRSVIVSLLFTLRASLRDRAALRLGARVAASAQVLERTRLSFARMLSSQAGVAFSRHSRQDQDVFELTFLLLRAITGLPWPPRRRPENLALRRNCKPCNDAWIRAHRVSTAGAATSSPSQPWRTFLANHLSTSSHFLHRLSAHGPRALRARPMSHHRRIVHVNVTEHPTSAWTAQQLVDAFPGSVSAARPGQHLR